MRPPRPRGGHPSPSRPRVPFRAEVLGFAPRRAAATIAPMDAANVPMGDRGGIGGHPRGLTTLFFTEMWERFSYYGMRSLLILFMVAPAAAGGLGFGVQKAALVYGTYTMSCYLLSIPG